MTNPSTDKLLPTYEALAYDIKSRGIDTVFGLMSDDTALFVTTLDAIGVRFYAARHENTAVAMAEGFASATGKLGIAIIGRGPATANAMHATAYAQRTGSRVLVIFGASSVVHEVSGKGEADTKEYNAAGVLEAAGIKTYVATDSYGARQTLANAISATRNGGCAALLLPMNVQFGLIDYPGAMGVPGPSEAAPYTPGPARPAALEAAAAILGKSRKPLFVAGLGAHRSGARAAIEALAEKVGAVVATTLKAKDMFEGFRYNAGVVGSFSHAAGRRSIEEADCIVAFGAGLNPRTTSFGTAVPMDVPLVHIDIAHNKIARWLHADVSVIADACEAANALLSIVPDRAAHDKPFHTEETRNRLAHVDLAAEFQAAYIAVPGPHCIKNTVDFASIGMGFGVAMGFAAGTPERTTVLFVGDGGFLMTLGELETAARENLPLVIVLMNDAAYGAELHYLKMRGMPVSTAVFADIDFAPIAQVFGFETATVRTLEELRALAPLLANPQGPILLDCKINASVAAPFLLETVEHEKRKA